MAMSANMITALINGGVVGLGALFGNHSQASNSASVPLAAIKLNMGNPEVVKAEASLLANMFMTSNPDAAATAIAIASNPTAVGSLLPSLEAEIAAQQGNILTTLAGAVALTGKSLNIGAGGISLS